MHPLPGDPAADVLRALETAGTLSATAAERVRRLAAQSGQRGDKVAVRLGLVAERDLAATYAAVTGLPVVRPEDWPAAPLPEAPLTPRFLRHARALPFRCGPDGLDVAFADPLDAQAARAIAFATGRPVRPHPAVPAELDAALGRLDGGAAPADAAPEAAPEAGEEDLDRVRDLASEAPIIRLVNQIIARAVELRASDIHLEAADAGLRLRYRIDGVLQDMEPPPAGLRAALVSRIKIMARLDIAERRLAQDGRIRLAVRGRDVDFRVSTTPSIHGESAVLRILDRDRLALDFAALGFDETLLAGWQELLARPHGILLVTGPTGSGKTTTLYASLARLNTPATKILTVEDPVEFTLAGVNQVQVKPQIGLTFATALRSFLRQDPDVLMIGEIRDLETAQIAIQAALTGHLVLSTVHTNDAASALTRLLDMGVEDYLLTSTITGILAQRLVRVLCPHCRVPYRPGPELRAKLEAVAVPPDAVLYHPAGCAACDGRGFTGRTMILELLPMSDLIRPMVLRHAEAREIRAQAVTDGMQPMLGHGLRKALAGVTTVEEVFRAVRDV